MKELLEIIRARRAQSPPELPFALATVVRVAGSSYRKPGARMLISLHGREAGSVSGGCLERDVITKGRAIILGGGPPELAVYDTTDQDDMAFGSSLGCEGRIEILVQLLAPGADWPLATDAATLAWCKARAGRLRLATAFIALRDREPLSGWDAALPIAQDIALGDGSSSVNDAVEFDVHQRKEAGRMYISMARRSTFSLKRLTPPTRLIIFRCGS